MILEIVGVVLFFNYYCTHTTTAHIPYYYLRACCWRQNKGRCQDELHGLVLHVMFTMNWKVTDEVHNGDLNSISRTCTIGLVIIVLPVHVRVVYTYWILKNWNWLNFLLSYNERTRTRTRTCSMYTTYNGYCYFWSDFCLIFPCNTTGRNIQLHIIDQCSDHEWD